MIRVLLGIASAGSPAQPFLDALRELRLPPTMGPLERSLAFGNFIPAQRELIAEDAVEGGYDFLFFVDDDIVLPSDALSHLLQTAEKDPDCAVVGGLYYSRDSMRPMVVDEWEGSDTTSAAIPAFTSTSTDIVGGVGFGCALLRVSTLAELAVPYFPVHVYLDRRSRTVQQCDEDYRYCERVRKAGFTVRLDARVRCAHYDRKTETNAPVAWEPDSETDHRRMMVLEDGVQKLVPFDDSVPRAKERQYPADVVYVRMDDLTS
jgi:hypothetical protein